MENEEILKHAVDALIETKSKKVAATKILRETTGLGLVDAKEIIDEVYINYMKYYNHFYSSESTVQNINETIEDSNEDIEDVDYGNLSLEELKEQIEKEKLIAELKALKQQNSEKQITETKKTDSSIKIIHDYQPTAPRYEKPLTKKQLIKENKKNGIACCPKCGSTSIQAGNKKLSVGRAIVGTALMPGVGTVLGGLSSKKTVCTCLVCGHKWKL